MKQPLSLSAQARRRLLGATLALTACGISAAHAQADYPNKPIRLIVPFANAGVTDTSAASWRRSSASSLAADRGG